MKRHTWAPIWTAAATVAVSLVMNAAILGASGARAEPEIAWRVENPFRFFNDPADTDVHRATFDALSADEIRTPVLSAERALSERHPEGWAATMFRKTCWHWVRNRHACQDGSDYINPKSHRVTAEVRSLDDPDTVECTWLTTPLGGARRGVAIKAPCTSAVTLEIPFPSGATVSVSIGGQRVAETAAKVTDLFIVGMGDSFASGEGNPDVPVRFSPERAADYGATEKAAMLGYPARVGEWKQIGDAKFIEENARWLDQACHRSLYSHQLRAALQLAVEEPHRAVTYAGVACSGAETTFGMFLRYKGHEWVPNPPPLSQLSAVAEAQCGLGEARAFDLPEAYHINEKLPELKGGLVLRKCEASKARKIDLILLSIGGNDVGFARLVANAVIADQSSLRRLGGWFGQVHGFKDAIDSLDKLDDRYKSLNRALHNILHLPWGESDRVVLTAYPPLATLEDGKSICPDGQAGMTVSARLQSLARKSARRRRRRRAPARHHEVGGRPASLDIRRRPPCPIPRPWPLRRLLRQRVVVRRRPAYAAQDQRQMGSHEPGRVEGLCLAPTLVPHPKRRLHDR